MDDIMSEKTAKILFYLTEKLYKHFNQQKYKTLHQPKLTTFVFDTKHT